MKITLIQVKVTDFITNYKDSSIFDYDNCFAVKLVHLRDYHYQRLKTVTPSEVNDE